MAKTSSSESRAALAAPEASTPVSSFPASAS